MTASRPTTVDGGDPTTRHAPDDATHGAEGRDRRGGGSRTAGGATDVARPRSRADELARRLLRIDSEVPGALVPMKGSLLLSAVRCIVTYVLIPVLVPLFGWLTPLAAPISFVLTMVAGTMAITSLRRVWAAQWSHRWAYTAFAVVVLLALAGLLVVDVLALLG